MELNYTAKAGDTVLGTFTRDTSSLPEASVSALLSRGFTHVLGNEVASKVAARIREAINSEKPSAVTTAEVKSYRSTHAGEVEGFQRDAIEAALKALDEGKLGVRESREKIPTDPFEAEVQALASAEISGILKANGLAMPKKGQRTWKHDDPTGALVDGVNMTFGQLIERRLAQHGTRIEKAAHANIAARERASKAAAAEGLASL